TVRLDDHRLHRVGFPSAGLPGTSPFASFGVTGLKRTLIRLAFPLETPVNGTGGFPITEVVVKDGKYPLQLTNFDRVDTFPGFLAAGDERAFFLASTNQLGENPYGNCEIFSVRAIDGGDLRQVTKFLNQGVSWPKRQAGCFTPGDPSDVRLCGLSYGYYRVLVQDPVTKTIVFDSSCD